MRAFNIFIDKDYMISAHADCKHNLHWSLLIQVPHMHEWSHYPNWCEHWVCNNLSPQSSFVVFIFFVCCFVMCACHKTVHRRKIYVLSQHHISTEEKSCWPSKPQIANIFSSKTAKVWPKSDRLCSILGLSVHMLVSTVCILVHDSSPVTMVEIFRHLKCFWVG